MTSDWETMTGENLNRYISKLAGEKVVFIDDIDGVWAYEVYRKGVLVPYVDWSGHSRDYWTHSNLKWRSNAYSTDMNAIVSLLEDTQWEISHDADGYSAVVGNRDRESQTAVTPALALCRAWCAYMDNQQS